MREHFKVDLRGIIDLAANHLYTTPDVFVRELIQNAVDAISARRVIDPQHTGVVRLELTPGDGEQPGTLCVTDDGIGLTLSEVETFLSTVGGSSKREDAEQVAERVSGDATEFLGRFGIGLLSCFVVSDEIVVITRSARQTESPAIEWRGRSDGSYAVRELAAIGIRPGTSVYLTPKEDFEDYFEVERLLELARRYGEMLKTPIAVVAGADETFINYAAPPWEVDPADTVRLSDYCQESLGFRPLDSFPVAISAGDVSGFLFIRPDRAADGSSARVYSQGMLVNTEVSDLLPRWAGFAGAVLNARTLRLTASREALQNDETLKSARDEIGAAIRRRLASLLRSDQDHFAAVMSAHDTEIRGLAVRDADFLELVVDLLEFETTLGPIRFGQFRREHEQLLLARTSEQFRRLASIAAALGLRVFNGGYTYHEELLVRAVQLHPELRLRSFDTSDLADLLEPPEDSEAFEGLISVGNSTLQGRECEVVVRDFQPTSIPAFFALGLTGEFHRRVDITKSIVTGIWKEILDHMAPRPEQPPPTRLCLNSRSPVTRRLVDIQNNTIRSTAVEVLYVQALMAGQHPLTGDELKLLNCAMDRLLRWAAGVEQVQ